MGQTGKYPSPAEPSVGTTKRKSPFASCGAVSRHESFVKNRQVLLKARVTLTEIQPCRLTTVHASTLLVRLRPTAKPLRIRPHLAWRRHSCELLEGGRPAASRCCLTLSDNPVELLFAGLRARARGPVQLEVRVRARARSNREHAEQRRECVHPLTYDAFEASERSGPRNDLRNCESCSSVPYHF